MCTHLIAMHREVTSTHCAHISFPFKFHFTWFISHSFVILEHNKFLHFFLQNKKRMDFDLKWVKLGVCCTIVVPQWSCLRVCQRQSGNNCTCSPYSFPCWEQGWKKDAAKENERTSNNPFWHHLDLDGLRVIVFLVYCGKYKRRWCLSVCVRVCVCIVFHHSLHPLICINGLFLPRLNFSVAIFQCILLWPIALNLNAVCVAPRIDDDTSDWNILPLSFWGCQPNVAVVWQTSRTKNWAGFAASLFHWSVCCTVSEAKRRRFCKMRASSLLPSYYSWPEPFGCIALYRQHHTIQRTVRFCNVGNFWSRG